MITFFRSLSCKDNELHDGKAKLLPVVIHSQEHRAVVGAASTPRISSLEQFTPRIFHIFLIDRQVSLNSNNKWKFTYFSD